LEGHRCLLRGTAATYCSARRWTVSPTAGYDGTTIAELAAATGMSKAAVSYHFPTKNDLLHALADPLLNDLDALIQRHPPAPTWPDQVRALLDDYLTTLTEHRQVAAWLDVRAPCRMDSHHVRPGCASRRQRRLPALARTAHAA
jgi:AcrR family transcriptional regulator